MSTYHFSPIALLSRVLLITVMTTGLTWAQDAPKTGEAQTPEVAKAEEVSPSQATAEDKELQQALNTLDQSSPESTLRSFLIAMNALTEGKDEFLFVALQCINLEGIDEEKRVEEGTKLAQDLYEVLSVLTIDFEEFKDADDIKDKNYPIVLGTNDTTFPLTFTHNDDGVWRFNRSKLEIATEKEIMKEVVEEAKKVALEIDAIVDPRLATPRDTMQTFIMGFDDEYYEKGGLEDAIATLDLSYIADSIDLEVGTPLATQLKKILDRHTVINYVEIPNYPKGAPYVVLIDPLDKSERRRIEIVPIPIEGAADAVNWKFSQESLKILNELWDNTYKDLDRVAGLGNVEKEILSLRLRDWMVANAPYLMFKPVIFENWKWLGMFISILLGMVVSRIITAILLRVVRRIFREERLRLDEKLESGFIRPIRLAIMAWVCWMAIKPLMLPEGVLLPLKTVIITISSSAFVWATYRLVDIVGKYIAEKARLTENKYDDLVVPLIVRSLKVFVLFIGVIFICQMNKWEYHAFLAGFGLVGMATALAAKDTLGNVFGSLTVLTDRPFQIGDWVQIGDVDGSVESVGIRSTRIRTFYNSVITVPNSILTTAVIDNYGARKYRRLKMDIAITYDTPPEKIDAFCEGIRELIRMHPYTRTDYFHVYLNSMADSSLNILLYCFHECPDWSTELRERHRLLLDIIRLAKVLGVEFAFPTSTLHMQAQVDAPKNSLSIEEGKSLTEGRLQAMKIVHENLGKNEPIPPPVTFDAQPGSLDGDNE